VTCVATGSAYVVPAVVGLKLQATRLRRRRRATAPEPDVEAVPVGVHER